MKINAYNFLLKASGLAQREAAIFHDVRLDTIKGWCGGKTDAPLGALEEIAELIGGMFAAMSSACLFPCGCCILIVGIIMGFTLKDDSTVPAVTVSTSVSVMGEEITESAIPMPDDDSDPAHAYYGGMIARGFDPELAEKMTKDHYPGFNE